MRKWVDRNKPLKRVFVCEKCLSVLISRSKLFWFFEHTKLFSWFDIGQINF